MNPYKYTIYPGFYESCGPEGEKLIEYVEKEWKKQPHVGELPLDIVAQVVEHGDKAVAAIDKAAAAVTRNKEEFGRLQNDMHCYQMCIRDRCRAIQGFEVSGTTDGCSGNGASRRLCRCV